MIRMREFKLFLASVVLAAMILACGTYTVIQSDSTNKGSTPTSIDISGQAPIQPASVQKQPTTPVTPLITTNEEALLIDLYRQINPSVVNIITYVDQGNLVSGGLGSGFLFDLQGHIVTNSHVVHGSDEIEVVFSDDTTSKAQIIGEDLHSDLAVIKVERLPENTAALPLGNMGEVAVGQTVVAIGNPFGLGGTLTRGIVSALGRTIPGLTTFSIPQAIQTDAPINPGNSGGPLINLKGEVIGVNAQIETGGTSRSNSGVGFAIPVSIVARVVPALIEKGEFEWSWLGVMGGRLNTASIEAMELPVNRGAYISQVLDEGPAKKAGLRGSTRQVLYDDREIEIGGDIIVAIDGSPVNSFDDILIYIALNTTPGQQVTLTIVRDGETQDIPLILERRPNQTIDPTIP